MRKLFIILTVIATPVWAVEPDEMLSDQTLEARAQAIDDEIRCVQCQSENIASSNADWARDARLIVRELVSDGASDDEVKSFFLERYGERVLMTPSRGGVNIVLWAAGPGALLLALIVAAFYLRGRRRSTQPETPLSEAEEARLREILDN